MSNFLYAIGLFNIILGACLRDPIIFGAGTYTLITLQITELKKEIQNGKT